MTDKTAKCGYCKLTDFRVCYSTSDIQGNEYKICHCNKCKAYFLHPRPHADLMEKIYNNEYYGNSEKKFKGIYENIMDYFRQRRAYKVSRLTGNNAAILDIGCGNGRFLKKLLDYGSYELYGTELEGNSARRAAKIPEIKLKIGELEESDFKPESLDAVTMFHVFEHLAEPEKTINIIHKILKIKSIIYISFPNINSFQARIFKGKWLHLDPPRHLFFFKPADFICLMENKGFEHIHSTYTSIEQNPFGLVQSTLNLVLKKRDVLFELLKGNKSYADNYSPIHLFFQKLYFFGSFPFFIFSDLLVSVIKKSATVEMIFRKKAS